MATKNQDAARAASKTREVSQQIHAKLADKFGDAVRLEDAVDPYTVVEDGTKFLDMMTYLKEDPEMDFDLLRCVTGVDYPDDKVIASVYHLFSIPKKRAHVVKFLCQRAEPEVPSVEGLWPTANWYEREAYDLLGIQYLGHSDLRRIMLPDDWVGHPLRKDYVEATEYQGIGTTRASAVQAFQKLDEARAKAREERGEDPPEPHKSPIKAPDKPAEDKPAEKKNGEVKAPKDKGEGGDKA